MSAQMWLPGTALNCYESDPDLRSWLLTPGLLTQRMRDTCGARFVMHVLRESHDSRGFVREIELCCDGQTWVFAQTDVPAATLAAQPWLAAIGQTSLGEALAAHGNVRRCEFEYAKLYDDSEVVAKALQRTRLNAQALWTRRSEFRVGAHGFTLQEVFLPGVGRPSESVSRAADHTAVHS